MAAYDAPGLSLVQPTAGSSTLRSPGSLYAARPQLSPGGGLAMPGGVGSADPRRAHDLSTLQGKLDDTGPLAAGNRDECFGYFATLHSRAIFARTSSLPP